MPARREDDDLVDYPRLPAAAGAARVPHLPHRERLPRHRHAAARARSSRRSSRRPARARATRSSWAKRRSSGNDRSLRRRVRPAARRARRARAPAAKQPSALAALLVLVSERPGHKSTHSPAETRLELARAAFPDDDVRLDPVSAHDRAAARGAVRGAALRARRRRVLRLPLLGRAGRDPRARASSPSATRPGFPRERLDAVLARSRGPTASISSTSSRIAAASTRDPGGRAADALVPPAVAALIRSAASTSATRLH